MPFGCVLYVHTHDIRRRHENDIRDPSDRHYTENTLANAVKLGVYLATSVLCVYRNHGCAIMYVASNAALHRNKKKKKLSTTVPLF